MKKRYLSTLVLALIAICTFAQNEDDALKFSQFLPSGTARYTAMGGAFGALGADLSVMATNPAGTGIYRKSTVGVSTAWSYHNTKSMFNDAKKEATELSFQLSNLGFVVVNSLSNNSNWKNFNFGFAYNHMNDYNRAISIKGDNNSSSLLDFQTDALNNGLISENDNAYYKADAVYFDTVSNTYINDYQLPQPDGSYGTEQAHQVKTGGYAGEYDFNISGNFRDFLFVGATVGIQNIRYEQVTYHSETPKKDIALHSFNSTDYMYANGNGFNFKLGMMLKITHLVRIGAAIHTPTIYNFNNDYWTDVNATVEYTDGIYDNTGKSPRGYYNWKFSSPARYMLSSAVVLSRLAIISGEVEYIDYSTMNMSASDYFFEEENSNIKSKYKGAFNAKLGVEFRLWILSLRAGAGYFDSPYKSTNTNSEAYKLLLSGGVGINAGNLYFDATYQYVSSSEYYYMYEYKSSKVALENNSHKFMATLGYRF